MSGKLSTTKFFGIGILFVGVILVGSLLWMTDSSDNVPNPNSLSLELVSPQNTLGLQPREQITLSVYADIQESGPTTSEVIVNFDPNVLQLVEIKEADEILAVNKSYGSNDGRATVDLAQIGQTVFRDGQKLVTLTFDYVPIDKVTNTSISVIDGSTIGISDEGGIKIQPDKLTTLKISL